MKQHRAVIIIKIRLGNIFFSKVRHVVAIRNPTMEGFGVEKYNSFDHSTMPGGTCIPTSEFQPRSALILLSSCIFICESNSTWLLPPTPIPPTPAKTKSVNFCGTVFEHSTREQCDHDTETSSQPLTLFFLPQKGRAASEKVPST